MARCFRWVLRALATTSGEKGDCPGRRWMSRCAALLRACTPASVRLEMVLVVFLLHLVKEMEAREVGRFT